MHNTTKLRSAHSAAIDNTLIKGNIRNAIICRPLSHQRTMPGIRQTANGVINSIDTDHTNEVITHSVLIDNASRRRGFLPYYYRNANTMEAIRRQRTQHKPSSKVPPTFLPLFKRSATQSNLTGVLTNTETELTEVNLIMHDKSMRTNPHLLPAYERQQKGIINMNDVEFATEIPNSLELILQNPARKSVVERNLLESLNRQRLEHTRYRTLPINRTPRV
ncbi:unnamed protein product [Adineta steineri]|uniref:Uncharacterized protein n=2 Tax=Adineta steineri TaxID=433720 RepID=A0A818NN04_9BILA|nr:unnamed protein product [Adineta steineri]CAF3829008.1 unnamed protein product [Adineta steineri]